MKSTLEITDAQWRTAQKGEHHYWSGQGKDGDDWNKWWELHFDRYYFIPDTAKSLLEVGCGPYAQNARRIMALHPQITELGLEDSLLLQYIAEERAVAKVKAEVRSSLPLEEMNMDRQFDVIVCINVLDHVRSVKKCFDVMYAHLRHGGMLIVGNDLTSDKDLLNCPAMRDDPMHPIKMDFESLTAFIFGDYRTIFLRVLEREQGRNPKAHYATLLWAGQKI